VRTRAAVLRHKLARAAAALGSHQFDTAAYYARSARHDAAAIVAQLEEASRAIAVDLHCVAEGGELAEAVEAAASPLIALILLALILWALRAGGARRKERVY
jgi:hypothetical protein